MEYSNDLVSAFEKAQTQLGSLAVLERLLPNPMMLIAPYMRREAVLSSRIEGTQASLSDVLEGEASGPEDVPPDTLEVMNYVWALRHGLETIRHRPMDLDLLREMHAILLRGVCGEEKQPGQFREDQNWIGHPGIDLGSATYVPPAPDAMRGCLTDLEGYLKHPPGIPNILQAALLHYQFEAIHPFRDANGRIGRLLITLFLVERRTLTAPYLYLSAYFERRRNDYYEALRRVTEAGAYDEWLIFFLDGVTTQAQDAVNRAHALSALHRTYQAKLQDLNATTTGFQILDRLFISPYISIPGAQHMFQVSFPTARRAIEDYLEPAGILQETTGRLRNRLWRASGVLKLLELDQAPAP